VRLEPDGAGKRGEPVGRRLDLQPADIGFAEDHLAVQVADLDPIVVDEAEPADPGRRQVERQRCAEPAHADDQHRAREQPRLTGAADFRQHDVPRIAPQGLVAQHPAPLLLAVNRALTLFV
jgi:hypothetical protein